MPPKNQLPKQATADDVIECECGSTVKVGLGGQHNLETHQKSKAHKRGMDTRKYPSVKQFFTPRDKPVKSSAQVPPRLHNATTVKSSAALIPQLVLDLRKAAASLPNTVPEGTLDDALAAFSERPYLDPAVDDYWETLDPILNGLLGWGKSSEDIKGLVRRGPLGLDGFCDWIECIIVDGGIGVMLLQDKVSRLLQVMNELSSKSPMISRNIAVPTPDSGQELQAIAEEITENHSDCSSAIIKDVNEVHSDSDGAVAQREHNCPGYMVKIPTGQSPFSSYPFAIHADTLYPWLPHFEGQTLYLQATGCAKQRALDIPCRVCAKLAQDPVVCRIEERMKEGAKEHTNWKWLSHSQLLLVATRLSRQYNESKLTALNTGRMLAQHARALEEHKRFLLAVASGNVGRMKVLVSTALRNGAGISGVLTKVSKAAQQLYSPRSYEEQEYRAAYLLWKFGGARCAQISHKALNLPSLKTIQRNSMQPALWVSARYPELGEIRRNIHAMYPYSTASVFKRHVGIVMLIDELAVEKRLRYDADNNIILGPCREHSQDYSLNFHSIAEANLLLNALRKDEIHLSSEATVVALGALTREARLHTARAIAVSGTCKKETAEMHAGLLQTVLQACRKESDRINGRIYCIASDGESKRGRALSDLTLQQSLKPNSPIFQHLGRLPLFNTLCGDDDLTADKDYKHIFKRLRNVLLRPKGVLIGNTLITASVLKRHLLDNNWDYKRVSSLLNPNDKQDVPLALSLLVAVWRLPRSSPSDPPLYAHCREAINLLGKIFALLVKPYTVRTSSLQEQLGFLGTAAHLILILYIQGHSAFIPIQLYSDIMIMIKNAYFCVAKTKVDDPDGDFFLTLLGTDRLEVAFGNLRTMVGNDTNADLLQVGSRLTGAGECALILASHPEWDRGPRRLHMGILEDVEGGLPAEKEELTIDADHLNPHSWLGDVSVAAVELTTCWRMARDAAEIILQTAHIDVDFQSMITQGNVDILSPFGKLAPHEGFDPIDEPEDGELGSIPLTSQGAAALLSDEELEPELEDIIGCARKETDHSTHQHPSLFVEVDGKPVYKATVLRLYSHPHTEQGPSSTDRLKRVRGFKRYEEPNDQAELDPNSVLGPSALIINDPALALVRCKTEVFLALIQICGLKLNGCSVQSLSLPDLQKSTTSTVFQVLRLCPRLPTPENPSDWYCDSSAVTANRDKILLEVSGTLVQVINPSIIVSQMDTPMLHFSTNELVAITALLHQRILENPACNIPTVKPSTEFPYRVEGRACFACESDGNDTLGMDINSCQTCGPYVRINPGTDLIAHNSAHILHDVTMHAVHAPCGFCLRSNSGCLFFLTKRAGGLQLDMKRSVCPKLSKFSYKAAATSKRNSPCSNVPVYCPICPLSTPALWKYNLEQHICAVHPQVNPEEYKDSWKISETERAGMKIWWKRIQRLRTSRKTAGSISMAISEGHSSRLALRSTDLVKDPPAQPHRNLQSQDTDEESDASESAHSAECDDLEIDDEGKIQEEEEGLHLAENTNGCTTGSPSSLGQDFAINASSAPQNLNPFIGTETSTTGRARRVRKTFLQEICTCGEGTQIDFTTDHWKSIPGIFECEARGCETRAFHLECFGLDYAPPGWVCDDCTKEGRRAARRPRRS